MSDSAIKYSAALAVLAFLIGCLTVAGWNALEEWWQSIWMRSSETSSPAVRGEVQP